MAAGAIRPLVRESLVQPAFHGESGIDGADLPSRRAGARPETAIELTAALVRGSDRPVTARPDRPADERRPVPAGVSGAPQPDRRDLASWAARSASATRRPRPSSTSGRTRGGGDRLRLRHADPDVRPRRDPPGPGPARRRRPARGARDADRARLRRPDAFFAIHHRDRYGWEGPPIHDAVAVGVLVAPWLIERRTMRVDVEVGDGLTRGRTVGDEQRGRRPGRRTPRSASAWTGRRSSTCIVEAVGRFP